MEAGGGASGWSLRSWLLHSVPGTQAAAARAPRICPLTGLVARAPLRGEHKGRESSPPLTPSPGPYVIPVHKELVSTSSPTPGGNDIPGGKLRHFEFLQAVNSCVRGGRAWLVHPLLEPAQSVPAMGRPKRSFGFFWTILQKNPNDLCG